MGQPRSLVVAIVVVLLGAGCGSEAADRIESGRSTPEGGEQSLEVDGLTDVAVDGAGMVWLLESVGDRQVVRAVDSTGATRTVELGGAWTSMPDTFRPSMAVADDGVVVAELRCGVEPATERCSEPTLVTHQVSVEDDHLVAGEWVAPVEVTVPEAVQALGGDGRLAFRVGTTVVDASGSLDTGAPVTACPAADGWVGVVVDDGVAGGPGSIDTSTIGEAALALTVERWGDGSWHRVPGSDVSVAWSVERPVDVRCGRSGPVVATDGQVADLAWDGTGWARNEPVEIAWWSGAGGGSLVPTEASGSVTGIDDAGDLIQVDVATGEDIVRTAVPRAVEVGLSEAGDRPLVGRFAAGRSVAVACLSPATGSSCHVWRMSR